MAALYGGALCGTIIGLKDPIGRGCARCAAPRARGRDADETADETGRLRRMKRAGCAGLLDPRPPTPTPPVTQRTARAQHSNFGVRRKFWRETQRALVKSSGAPQGGAPQGCASHRGRETTESIPHFEPTREVKPRLRQRPPFSTLGGVPSHQSAALRGASLSGVTPSIRHVQRHKGAAHFQHLSARERRGSVEVTSSSSQPPCAWSCAQWSSSRPWSSLWLSSA